MAVTAASGVGHEAKLSLRAETATTVSVDAVAGLLDPDNPWLAAAWSPARRLLAVVDDPTGPRARALREYLRAAERRGALDGHLVLEASRSAVGSELELAVALCEAAAGMRLGRRDRFVAFGGDRVARCVALASAMFRRSTMSLSIHADPAPAFDWLYRGGRAALTDQPVAVRLRHVHAVVDEDGLAAGGCGPGTRTVRRRVPTRLAYDVRLGSGLLDPDIGALAACCPPGARVLAVVDDYPDVPLAAIERCLDVQRARGRLSWAAVRKVRVTAAVKTMDTVGDLLRAAARAGLGRGDLIVAIGGGTLMDMVGHAAFLFAGDTPYVRVPTTLVGMIDAGIGLKVGVNLGERKNVLGAYHPPAACLCDVGFLDTLPAEEARCGVAEAIKIALVRDPDLFALIENRHAGIVAGTDPAARDEFIVRAISAMLHELESNPFEDELRRLPDFGHELGHLVESRSEYRLRHGEAVSIGMALSCHLAASAGRLARADLERVLALLEAVGLPVSDPACDPEALWRDLHAEVVPHQGGALHLAVPFAIGRGGFLDAGHDVSPAALRLACASLRARAVGDGA